VRLFTRNGHDCTERFAVIARAVAGLRAREVVLDGELVASGADDRPDFYGLTLRRCSPDALKVWAFDCLWLTGKDLRPFSLVERRFRLEGVLERLSSPFLCLSESFADGDALFRQCERLRLEGVVSKRKDAPYRSGRSTSWVKVKCQRWRETNRERYRLFEKAR
jgi:bifunctional non-homologous end joining protein LigD